jgi:Flp pilus assembly protein TadD
MMQTQSVAALVSFLLVLATSAHAQQAVADSAWAQGDFHTARINYERVLQSNPHSVRANYRLGILASWDGQLDSALVMIRRAREVEPRDPDLRSAEARVLAWDGRYDQSIIRYDSVVAEFPDHAEALAGLGQVYLWQGKLSRAREYSNRAVAADPENRAGRELDQAVDRATAPSTEPTVGWSNDSDGNTSWWEAIAGSYLLSDGLRAFGSIGALQASDPIRNASRLSGETGVAYGMGDAHASIAIGVRRLSPNTGSSRTEGTYRASVGYRVGSAGIGIGFAHYPFDETALLIERNVDLDALELSGDVTIQPGLTLSAGGGKTWLSDENSRASGVLVLTQTVHRDFFIGAMARVLGYEFTGVGYFSPDRFTVYEIRGGYTRNITPWSWRISGGLGTQQVGSGAKSQSEGHLEGRLGRNWSNRNVVEVFAGISNSAESSTTGAFRYRTAGLVIRLGL